MMKRLAAMHDCPLLMMRALTAVATARGRSALARTMNASLPPSSSTLFLMLRPAAPAMSRPAPSLPVTVTAATRSSAMIAATRSDPTSSVWNTPAGAPARAKRSSSASAHWGTFDACLSRPTLPAASAGAANRITCQKGKFQGITASTAPRGWKKTASRPFASTSGRRKASA